MIKIGRLTDYAIIVVTQMATNLEKRHTVPALSEGTGVPEPTVSKIMKKISKTDIVTSHRGVNGGYSLNKQGSEIPLLDIIEIMDGPIQVVDCVNNRKSDTCVAQHKCPIRGNWDKVNKAIVEGLGVLTIADMNEPNRRLVMDVTVQDVASNAKKPANSECCGQTKSCGCQG